MAQVCDGHGATITWAVTSGNAAQTVDAADYRLLSETETTGILYRGNWGKETNVYVGGVTVVRSNQVIDSPRDGSNYWDFRCSADYQVSYFHNRVEVA